ncbi:DoxX family membrane protein, partial [Candidatus Woesearchaeota archaeon]|nr:DoxX family membrane protein [Candidatus Woesearchaeota archaeon]
MLEFLFNPTLILIIRVLVGAALIVSGFLKIIDLKGFVYIVEGYSELTRRVGKTPAYILPFVEVIVGAMLIAGFYLVYAAVLSMLMAILFGTMVMFALATHKKLKNCGCLGAKFKIPITWKSLAEDIIFFLLALLILLSALGITS